MVKDISKGADHQMGGSPFSSCSDINQRVRTIWRATDHFPKVAGWAPVLKDREPSPGQCVCLQWARRHILSKTQKTKAHCWGLSRTRVGFGILFLFLMEIKQSLGNAFNLWHSYCLKCFIYCDEKRKSILKAMDEWIHWNTEASPGLIELLDYNKNTNLDNIHHYLIRKP